ncbi:MerR family transcriptional regulator [uncultured Metabacillus sp.]|uniref:MerR family transcriptional regulator n=1 Tax=uncultured Metabacillus sp. TaxID=2860135 RepID=UPI0026299535|nr:MerR family transcriptional regulator [uncultured Metabacillus sp.]
MGEIAKKANVSKRTIDYYTQIGLLQVESTSSSNYRLYSEQSINDIRFIEMCKELNMSLQDIKERLELKRSGRQSGQQQDKCLKQAEILAAHMKQLEIEINELKPIFDRLSKDSQKKVSKQITPQSRALMQSLLFLLQQF